jgi:HPt (histidine-containing phosphotransfer) domain-containing protein
MGINLTDQHNQSVGKSAGVPLDLEHLRRFTLGDRELELEVLHLFIDQAPRTIAELRKAETADAWRRAAHTLKGSARAVGAWRLATLAEQAERLGHSGEVTEARAMLSEIDDATREANAYIAKLDASG